MIGADSRLGLRQKITLQSVPGRRVASLPVARHKKCCRARPRCDISPRTLESRLSPRSRPACLSEHAIATTQSPDVPELRWGCRDFLLAGSMRGDPDERRKMPFSGKSHVRDAGNEPPCAPVAASIPDAQRISGLSRSEIYRRLADGSILACKSGTRTLVLLDSLRAHMASLPVATFGVERRVARSAAPNEA